MDDIKSSIRGGKGREWAGGVPLNLGTLTLYTGACPSTNVSVDTRPHKRSSDELLGSSDSWMGEVM